MRGAAVFRSCLIAGLKKAKSTIHNENSDVKMNMREIEVNGREEVERCTNGSGTFCLEYPYGVST